MVRHRPDSASYSELPMERVDMESQQAAIICSLVRTLYSFQPTVVDIKRIKPPSKLKKVKPATTTADEDTGSGGDGSSSPATKNTPDPSRVATFYIADTRDHYCLNKGGEHSHSHVYFIITMNGIYQKCFCRKGDIYRPGGVPCSEYRSKPEKIPSDKLDALFSQYAKREAKRIHNREALIDMLHGPQHRPVAETSPAPAGDHQPLPVTDDIVTADGDELSGTKQHPPPTKRRRLNHGSGEPNEKTPAATARGGGGGGGKKKRGATKKSGSPQTPHAGPSATAALGTAALAAGASTPQRDDNVFRKALKENKMIRGRTRF
jgi:hypothetical protein